MGGHFWGVKFTSTRYKEGLTAAWLASYDRRFKPYQAYFDAMELIDPTAPDSRVITPEVWDAVKHICEHFGLDFFKVQKELRELHRDAEELTRQDSKLCKEHLLKYYHDVVSVLLTLSLFSHVFKCFSNVLLTPSLLGAGGGWPDRHTVVATQSRSPPSCIFFLGRPF